MQYAQLMATPTFGTDGQLALKTDVLPDYLGDKLGVPMAVRNSAAERAVLMEDMQKNQAIAAAAQAQAMAAQGQGGAPAPAGMPA
jgi:hypothetical protein